MYGVLGNASQRSLFETAGLTFRAFERTPEPPVEQVTPERVRLRMTQVKTAHDEQRWTKNELMWQWWTAFCYPGSPAQKRRVQKLLCYVPLLCLPMVNDEPLVAERIAALGAGITVSPLAEVEEMRSSILRVLREPAFNNSIIESQLNRIAGNYKENQWNCGISTVSYCYIKPVDILFTPSTV